MKKVVLVLLLIIFIVPSIALAFWWNPFSWKIFNRSVEPKIEQPATVPDVTNTVTEESPKVDQSVEIEKLKKEVEGLKKKTNPVVSTPKPSVKSIISNTSNNQSIPQIQNPVSQPQEDPALKIAKCQADATAKKYDLISKGDKMAEDTVSPKIAEFEAQIKQIQAQGADDYTRILNDPLLTNEARMSLLKGSQDAIKPGIDYDKAGILSWQKALQTMKQGIREKAETYYNDLYLKCLGQ